MEAEKANHSVVLMARVLRVSRSGFYDWRNRRTGHDLERACRIEAVKRLPQAKRGSLGSRRMAKRLQRQGYAVGRYQARSLMREAGVVCRQRRRFRATTVADHRHPVAPNRLARCFDVGAPNRAWCADMTALWTDSGWLYLAAVLDLGNREIVGWAMAGHMRTALVRQALEMAIGRRRPGAGLIHHSDRGSQYTAQAYQALLQRHNMVASMSRKGDCWDNAVMERFFGTLKSEWTDSQRYASREQAKQDVIRFIEMEYNSDRDHSTLGYITPRGKGLAAVA
jgi:transposase InsO family protein